MKPPPFKVLQSPASEAEIARLTGDVGSALPSSYIAFLQSSNGAECGPNDEPGDSMRILNTTEVIPFNQSYAVWKHLPDVLCFASDGGDYAFAFRRSGPPDNWPILRIPLGALFEEDVQIFSRSFSCWQDNHFRYSASPESEQSTEERPLTHYEKLFLRGQLLDACKKADDEFRRKNYKRVVTLLEPYASELEATAASKLAYAKKKTA